MTISTTAGATISIGPANAVAANEAAYVALTYVDIGEVESLGDFGDTSNLVNFTSLSDARVRKLKGSRDAGELALVVGNDPEDAGQIALQAAEATKFTYAFKVELADMPEPGGTNTVIYFRALVNGANFSVGEADNVVRRNFALPIDSALVVVPAEGAP